MAPQVSALRSSPPHIHTLGTQCPVCDQPIPNEKAEEVRARIEAREREVSDAVAVRLREQFAAERVQIEANGRTAVDQAKRDGIAAVEAIKTETAKRETAVREAAQQQIDTLTRTNAEAQAAAKQEIEAVLGAAAQREAAAREEGSKAGQAAAQDQIKTLQQANAEQAAAAKEQIEGLKHSHAEQATAAKKQIDDLKQANADVHAAAQQKIETAERAKAETEAAARERVIAAEKAKVAAENAAKALKEQQEALMNERLQEQREALEKDKAVALSAKDAKHFEVTQKLKENLEEVQRKLEKKTADELGEGGELDLFEELKAQFEGDRIRRVPKGTAGADIIHEVVEDGKLCGKIVYDSKKRGSWKSEYATKLCEDKIAEGADHAVLSLLKFPADTRQLEVRDGVILANPARVSVLAEILRDDIVRAFGLRLSNEERESKKGELYAYIMSERFRQQMDSIETQTDRLLDIDVAEQKAHRKLWETRGGIVKTLQKAHGNLRADVARIIGTYDVAG